jgi:tRNA(Ile)-lysidine synthetase-like protein
MDAVLTSPGSYVIAVSGGVDSMALLHALQQKNLAFKDKPWKLVVAHFDHGMRDDSAEDRKLVQVFAKNNGLRFVYEEGRLGIGASEARARDARYRFLRKALKNTNSSAIVTAHHQDDVLETAIINLLRGSGRKGLTSLGNRPGIERPLLAIPKRDLIAYAKDQGLRWREDSTNQDTDYLRNYVRHYLLPRFDEPALARLREIIDSAKEINREIDSLLLNQLDLKSTAGNLDRYWFTQLPHAVARETMAAWLRAHGLRDFDSKTLERLVVAAKVAAPGKTFDVLRGSRLAIGPDHLALA